MTTTPRFTTIPPTFSRGPVARKVQPLRRAGRFLGALGAMTVLLTQVAFAAYDHQEQGDAGDHLNAQLTFDYGQIGSSLALQVIEGDLEQGDVVDAYCIRIDDPTTFRATTNPLDDPLAGANFDTRLFLFEYNSATLSPIPRMANDDSPSSGLTSLITDPSVFPGQLLESPPLLTTKRYILAVTGYPEEFLNGASDPYFDFPAGFTALHGSSSVNDTGWSQLGSNRGHYQIALTGASGCGPGIAFLTEETGTSDFSSWSSAGGYTGLVAADEICTAEATASGLRGVFKAFASDAVDDAYCRAFGYQGKKTAGCDIPGGTSPELLSWVGKDGLPFVRDFDEALVNDRVYYPLKTDLGGGVVDIYWTGSDAEGQVEAGLTCGDWTGVGVNGLLGSANAGGEAWLSGASGPCDISAQLLCLQNRFGPRAPEPQRTDSRLAFVSSASGSPDLSSWPEAGGQSGLAAGDAICQELAGDAGLGFPSSYVAYLSTTTIDARDRLPNDRFPWTRLDGSRIGTWAEVNQADGARSNLSFSESDAYTSGLVATGTQLDGTVVSASTCGDWTLTTGMGEIGLSDYADSLWKTGLNISCSEIFHLYCFATHWVDLFSDGFESGDTVAWD